MDFFGPPSPPSGPEDGPDLRVRHRGGKIYGEPPPSMDNPGTVSSGAVFSDEGLRSLPFPVHSKLAAVVFTKGNYRP